MKKRILILTVCLWVSATFAFAGNTVSYNPSFNQKIKTLFQWVIGNQRIAIVTSDSCVNGEKVFTITEVWLNHFTREITFTEISRATGQPCGQ